MERRTFLKSGAALPFALAATPGVARAARQDTPWRVFEVTTRVDVAEVAGATRVWLPLPLARDTDYFKNLGSAWSADGGVLREIVEPRYRAAMVSAEFAQDVEAPSLTVVSRFATRDRAVRLSQPSAGVEEERSVLRQSLEATELLPTDGIVRDTARGIVRGQRNEIDRARAIYEWVVENTFRDAKVRGCGWGDVKSMLETGNFGGKCGDLNAMFVALCRSVGIPARDVYGLRVAKSRQGYVSLGASTENVSRAQHCRAEFYVKGYGWIPVDPADVRKVVLEEPPGNLPLDHAKVQAARERLFGAWEMNWLAYNYAHDVQLPGSNGARIPYLMYPNGETAKGRLDSLEPDQFRYSMTAREIPLG
jgi:transglutaminase-like putative cysteine protease